VLAKRAEAGGDDRAVLRRVEEDMSRHLWGALKPVRLVECSAIDAEYLGKSFKIEK
jgi:hypothetical protein